MKTVLTDRILKAMKPAASGTRKMIWDSAVPSFGVRVTDKGKLTFIVMRRLHGKPVWRMLGQYPIMRATPLRNRDIGWSTGAPAAGFDGLRDKGAVAGHGWYLLSGWPIRAPVAFRRAS